MHLESIEQHEETVREILMHNLEGRFMDPNEVIPNKILMVGRDNVEILKAIEENREEMIKQGIDIDQILATIDQQISLKEGWPDPIPFKRLMEDMKEDYLRVAKKDEHWSPGQGAPMKRGKKRR